MSEITTQQLEEAILARGYKPWTLRRCSICEEPIGYVFAASEGGGSPRVGFDSYCGCSRFDPGVEERSLPELANCFNMQEDAIRERMWAEFAEPAAIRSGEKADG